MTPEKPPTLQDLDRRLSNVEQLLIELHARMLPKWARATALGAFLGACLKVLVS